VWDILKYAFFPKYFIQSNDGRYKLRKWSKAIIKRDKKCVVCGSRKRLEAHHLFDKNTYPHKALDINNGVTLCKKCHTEFHRFNGGFRKSCTYADFRRFMNRKKKNYWWIFIIPVIYGGYKFLIN